MSVCFSKSQICNDQSNSLRRHNQWHISLQVHLLAQFNKWECSDVCMHTADWVSVMTTAATDIQLHHHWANHFILITKQGLLINQSVSYFMSVHSKGSSITQCFMSVHKGSSYFFFKCLFTTGALQSISQYLILCLFTASTLQSVNVLS